MSVTPLLFLRIHSRPAFEVRPDVNRKLIELACADPLIHRRLSMFALTSAEIINSLGFLEDRAIEVRQENHRKGAATQITNFYVAILPVSAGS